MAKKKPIFKRNKKGTGFDLKHYLPAIGSFAALLVMIVIYRYMHWDHKLFPISIMALIMGVLFESKRLVEKWSTLLTIVVLVFLFSLVSFIPGKNETVYDLEKHMMYWPYVFIFLINLVVVVVYPEKVTSRLTEGITLLLSIAACYWVLDYGFINTSYLFLKVLLGIGLAFALYAIYHAFSYAALSRTSRLVLSIWSTIVMVMFAIDNIILVYQNEEIEQTIALSEGAFIGLQYFLLGVSSVYVFQNFMLLTEFLPGKGTFFNKEYFANVRALKKTHVKRYSDEQMDKAHSLFCLVFTTVCFGLNYYFQFLPRQIAIWTVIVIFPYVLFVYDKKTNP